MKALILTAAVLFGIAALATAQSKTGKPMPIAITTNTTVTATTTAAPAGLIMKRLDRRKLGLTARNIISTLKTMKAEGALEEFTTVVGGKSEVDVSSLAVAVVDRIKAQNPEGWIDWENIDWDAIIAFVEWIISVILPLFL